MTTDNVDLFENQGALEPPAIPENPMDALVGPDKKYKTVEDAIKALAYSQRHIERLEHEQSELRADLKTRLTLEEFMTKISSQKNDTVMDDPEPGNDVPAADNLTPDKVLELVRSEKAKETRAQNAKTVKDALIAKYGHEYVNALRVKAEQLGLSPEDVNEMSQTKPKAILALLGVEDKPVTPSIAPPRNAVNSLAQPSDGNRKNYAYYEKLRKEKPIEYFSSRIQLEMDREAQRQGPSFFT